METKSIPGVEVFSVGTWNGDEYTHDDLREMVRAFNETKQHVKPFLKLGHDEEQKLVQSDGLPSAGWIERLYVLGDKLVADFVDIPKKIHDLIVSKAYRKVSSEIYWNLKVQDKTYGKFLSAVALLGADTPGVMNLNDILAMYKKMGKDGLKIYYNDAIVKDLEIDNTKKRNSKMSKTESEIKLEIELQDKQKEVTELSQKVEQTGAELKVTLEELASLKQFKIEADKKALELEAEAKRLGLEKIVTELQSEKLITPAMKPYVLALLGEEKKKYSIELKDKKSVEFSKEEILKETLKLFKVASEVNFTESSEDAKGEAQGDVETDKQIREYAEKHKVTYAQAYKAIKVK